MSDPALRELAEAAGLHVEWKDASGERKVVSAESLRAILQAMGLPSGSETDLRDSRAELQAQQETGERRFASVVAGEWASLPHLGGGAARFLDEDGAVVELAAERDNGGLRLRAPEKPGYYQEADGELTLAVAPPRAWTVTDAAPGRRIWGAAAQLYALRGWREGPFGDFAALRDYAAALGRRGADALAISPVHALFAADPSRFGPYAPSTRLFLNVLFADLEALGPSDVPGEPGGELIDWPSAGAARMATLRALHARFRTSASEAERTDLARFRQAGGADLEGHARFETLHARFLAESGAGGWQAWPDAFHDPRGTAVQAYARDHADEVDLHVFLQWLADRGLAAAQAAAKEAGMAVGLIADLAVGMDAGGSHAWSRPDDLLNGLSVGAPPDIFQPAGQDWGLAAFSPAALRRSGFEPFIATLRATMKHAGGVRIDHAMGLQRLWLSPQGANSADGAYLSYPLQDMLRLIALESWRHKAVVVGEDLGTVPEGFREATTAMGMYGMRVLWFERDQAQIFIPPERWTGEAMAMTSTHDLPTVAGWWRGRDIDWMERLARKGRHSDVAAERAEREVDRERLWRACTTSAVAEGSMPATSEAEDAVDAAVAYVAEAACELAIVPLEDLLGLEEQPNHPGTTDEAPNWRRRLAAGPDTELGAPRVGARIARLDRARPRQKPASGQPH